MRVGVEDDRLESNPPVPHTVWRLRELAVCVVLTAVVFLQQPGKIVPDSKIDLAINPVTWLARSLHLWEPAGAFGQLQNQAYGYLWPMGPLFAAGSGLGIPAWAVQRLWWALIVCVAFTGLVRLADRLHIGTPGSRLIAGVAFALSPRFLTELGALSIEAWPSAVAPWVLVPLIGLAKGARIRRAVALSALAIATAGGVNATAVFAVVPLAVLWLLTLAPLRRRLAALMAWGFAVICATAWWFVPLLVLGAYSPPFLDFIENAAATTSITDSVTNLRGTSHWVAYLTGPFGPSLPTGWRLANEPLLVAGSVVVVALGIAGLARRGLPYRRFLVSGLVLGFAMVGLGHVSELDGTFAGAQRAFLDGIGAPLRNVHKFDVIIRIPLVLGLAHLLGVLARVGAVRRWGFRYAPAPAALVTVTAMAAITVVAIPAITGGLAPERGFKEVPAYWHEAADWLDDRVENDRVLVIPGARFPHYTWGSTLDEITQPLLRSNSVVRNAIPLAPATTIRLLDAVESALATGAGSTGLADLLARSGVRYLLVRSDLDYGMSGTIQPVIVRQALERSPGLSYVTGFGPQIDSERSRGRFVDHGLGIRTRALEVFQVDRSVSPVVAYDTKDVSTVVGGPESLIELAAAGQLTDAPTILAGDLPGGNVFGPVAVTDGMRRRAVAFGQGRDNTSATLTTAEADGGPRPARDYLPEWGKTLATTVAYRGVTAITAASSWAQVGISGGSRPEHHPYAAFDGDPATSWHPAPGRPSEGQWITVEFDEARVVKEVKVYFDGDAGALPTRISVDAGVERVAALTFGDSVTVKLPGVHATRTVRVNVEEVLVSSLISTFGISEIVISGVEAVRTLTVPPAPESAGAASVVLTAAASVPSCFFEDGRPRCSPDVARGSEDGIRIDRTVTLSSSGVYQPTIWTRPRPGYWLNAILDRESAESNPLGLAPSVVASSSAVDDPAGRPGAILDGDPRTAWMPAANDGTPMLRLGWLTPRRITGLRLVLDSKVAATQPGAVRVVGNDGIAGGFVNGDGVVLFDRPLLTDHLTIFLLDSPRTQSYNPYTTKTELKQVAVGEVTIFPGTDKKPIDLDEKVVLECGSGPTLEVDGTTIRTRVSATRKDLLELRETVAQPCDNEPFPSIALTPGSVRVIASPSGLATASRIALTPDRIEVRPTATPVRIDSWSAAERRVSVTAYAGDRILAVRENTNPGWQAQAGGQVLTPIVVDGWQQGWLIPAGYTGEIVLRFVPDVIYRAGLLGGALLLLVVVVLAAIPVRRRGSHAPQPIPARHGRARVIPFVVGAGAMILIGGYLGGAIVLMGVVAAAYRFQVPRRPSGRPSGALELWLPAVLLLIGGWLSLTVDNSHRAVEPQVIGLLAVGGLWLSVVARTASRPALAQPLQRPFEHVVADRGDGDGASDSQPERAQEVPGEVGTIGEPVNSLQHQRVPEEDAIRDRA